MSQHNRFAVGALAAALGIGGLVVATTAQAFSGYLSLWESTYSFSLSSDNALGARCATMTIAMRSTPMEATC